jgi:DNA-binding CsgD family transcriptional regulator
LTQREREIFELVRRGMRSREIGERLFIAEATVYKHIQNILDKLHVHSRTQAILAAELLMPALPTALEIADPPANMPAKGKSANGSRPPSLVRSGYASKSRPLT